MKKQEIVDGIVVTVTRLGADPVNVDLAKGATVADALAKAGVTSASNSQYFVDGVRAEMNDVVEHKDILSIVTPKQAGNS